MKLHRHDRDAGFLRIQVDSPDDLWSLHNLVEPGDLVEMDTYRTAESSTDKLREGKQEKRRMRLGVRVQNVEWHDFDDHLRIHGTIETGPQDHTRHHTLVVRNEHETLDIHKPGPLRPWHLEQVRQAEEAAKAPQVVLMAIDDGEAQFAVLRGYGIQWLGTVQSAGQGKRYAGAPGAKKAFYDEVARTLKTLRPGQGAAIVVGPGWWREEFIEHVRQGDAAAAQGLLTDGTSQAGRRGIHEALQRGLIEHVARDHRVAWEMEQVEKVMHAMATGAPVAYGPQEVQEALAVGAADEVLITDRSLRDGRFAHVVSQAEATRAKVHVIASGHEAGQRLEQLAGIAALLRFQPQ